MKQVCEECNRTFGHDKGCSFDGASFQWERQNPRDTEITIVTGKGSWKTTLKHPNPPRYEPAEEITTIGEEGKNDYAVKYFFPIGFVEEYRKLIAPTPLIKNKADFIAGLVVLGVMVGLVIYAGLELL